MDADVGRSGFLFCAASVVLLAWTVAYLWAGEKLLGEVWYDRLDSMNIDMSQSGFMS